jgi:hypothetical protein
MSQATDVLSVLCESTLLGPLRWGFSHRIECRILLSVGYSGILIPDNDAGRPVLYGLPTYLTLSSSSTI